MNRLASEADMIHPMTTKKWLGLYCAIVAGVLFVLAIPEFIDEFATDEIQAKVNQIDEGAHIRNVEAILGRPNKSLTDREWIWRFETGLVIVFQDQNQRVVSKHYFRNRRRMSDVVVGFWWEMWNAMTE